MKRVVFSIVSFAVFILEFSVQLFFIFLNTLYTIYYSFLFGLVRYHNRIQLFTTRTNYVKIEEVKT
jgi:hypothetical protein